MTLTAGSAAGVAVVLQLIRGEEILPGLSTT